ncbi:ankyrin [Apiospora sp. TS-2023a]
MSNTHDKSHFERLPNEIHANIAWYCGKQTTARISKASHTLHDVYSDLLYRNNVEHEDCSAMFAIAKTGKVECFEKLVHFAKTVLNKPMPDFDRYEVVVSDIRMIISTSPRPVVLMLPTTITLPERCCTPLHLAVAHGNHAAAAYLLERGVDVDVPGVLRYPTFRPVVNTIDWSIDNLARNEINTALHIAVCRNDLAMCRLLVDNGASMLCHSPGGYGHTMLHLAALCGHATIVKWLVQSGHVAIDAFDHSSHPLRVVEYAAATKKGTRILGLFQHLGADVTAAADVMIQNGRCSELLGFIRNPKLRKRSGDYGTAFETQLLLKVLDMPFYRGMDKSMLRMQVIVDLLDMGANVRHVTSEDINACNHGLSALSWAVFFVCISGNTGPLTHLISHGAIPSIGRSVCNAASSPFTQPSFSHLATLCAIMLKKSSAPITCLEAATRLQEAGARFMPENQYAHAVNQAKELRRWDVLALLRSSAPDGYNFSSADLEAFRCLDAQSEES